MIKYFHELTLEELKELAKKNPTWQEVAADFPQPKWCGYPDAVAGGMGCWSLMLLRVSKNFCKGCDCYQEAQP